MLHASEQAIQRMFRPQQQQYSDKYSDNNNNHSSNNNNNNNNHNNSQYQDKNLRSHTYPGSSLGGVKYNNGGSGLGSGIGSGLGSGMGSGLGSALGSPSYDLGYQTGSGSAGGAGGSKVSFPAESLLFTPRDKNQGAKGYFNSSLSDPLDTSGSMDISSTALPSSLLNR